MAGPPMSAPASADADSADPASAGRPRAARSRGFTLVELLVTLMILAGLVAILFPVVAGQVEQSEPTRIAADLQSISSGLDMFRAHVLEVPDGLEDLANPITTDDRRLDGERYRESQTRRWRGPYIDVTFLELDEALPTDPDSLDTGFEGWIMPNMALFNSRTNDSLPLVSADSANYGAIMIRGLSTEDFELLNDVVDGPSEEDGDSDEIEESPCPICSWDRGKLRWDDVSQVAYYLVIPFQSR